MGRILLDPNAVAYTDDQIVGKVNAATAKVNADQTEDGTVNKVFTATEDSKLAGVEENAKDDQNGAEIKTAYEAEANAFTDAKDTKLTGIEADADVNPTDDEIVAGINAASTPITREAALSQADLKVVKSEPASGERAVTSVSVDADDKLAADHSDTPEP